MILTEQSRLGYFRDLARHPRRGARANHLIVREARAYQADKQDNRDGRDRLTNSTTARMAMRTRTRRVAPTFRRACAAPDWPGSTGG